MTMVRQSRAVMPVRAALQCCTTALAFLCLLPSRSDAGLHVEPNVLRFAPTVEGTTISTTVLIVNRGAIAASAALRPSCDCIVADRDTIVVPPQGSTPVVVSFLTEGYTGYHAKMLFIAPHEGAAEYLTFTMEGTVLPRTLDQEPPHPAAPSTRTAARLGSASTATARMTPSSGVPPTHREFRLRPGTPAPSGPERSAPQHPIPAPTSPTLQVALFSNTGCTVCEQLARHDIPNTAASLGIRVDIREYPVEQGEHFALLLRTERLLGAAQHRLPVLIVGSRLLGGAHAIRAGLRDALQEAVASSATVPTLAPAEKTTAPIINLLVLAGAAFIDGINPCAFGAIILFVTYLTTVRRRPRRDILATGACFIAGVFLAYLLIGLGIRHAIAHLAAFRLAARALYGVVALVVAVLGVLSVMDAVTLTRIRSGGTGTVLLKLPAALRWKILDAVERWAKTAYIAPAAFVLGLAISLLEFLCTGQIYLPAIIYMHSVDSLRARAWLALLVYCTMFVVPLVIVFAGLLFGMESRRLEEFARRHTVGVKLATGMVFLALGALLAHRALTG